MQAIGRTVGQLEGDWIWESSDMSIIWTIIIGFVAGIVAKFLHPGSSNEPSGFILTAALGIAGAFVRPTSDKPLAGTALAKGQALSARSSGPSSCWLFGAS